MKLSLKYTLITAIMLASPLSYATLPAKPLLTCDQRPNGMIEGGLGFTIHNIAQVRSRNIITATLSASGFALFMSDPIQFTIEEQTKDRITLKQIPGRVAFNGSPIDIMKWLENLTITLDVSQQSPSRYGKNGVLYNPLTIKNYRDQAQTVYCETNEVDVLGWGAPKELPQCDADSYIVAAFTDATIPTQQLLTTLADLMYFIDPLNLPEKFTALAKTGMLFTTVSKDRADELLEFFQRHSNVRIECNKEIKAFEAKVEA